MASLFASIFSLIAQLFFPLVVGVEWRKKTMTKILLIAAFSILLSGTAAFAQTAEKPAKTDEIEALSQKWMEAARDHDLKPLQDLLADDFKLVRASQDKPITRAEWLEGLGRL